MSPWALGVRAGAGWLQRMAADEGACERFQEVHNDILALLRVRCPPAGPLAHCDRKFTQPAYLMCRGSGLHTC